MQMYGKRSTFYGMWAGLLLAMALVSCKTPPSGCLNSTNKIYVSAHEGPNYHGGFLRIYQQNQPTQECDAVIMPHSDGAFHNWEKLTFHVDRSCLAVEKGFTASLLLYLGLGDLYPYEYVEIPIDSAYLSALADNRSAFIAAYDQFGSGRDTLTKYERMIAQIHRMKYIDYQSSYEAHGWLQKNQKLSQKSIKVLKNLQTDACSHGVIPESLHPVRSQRYQALLKLRINEDRQKNLACYLFNSLVYFDGKVTLTDSERTQLSAISQITGFSLYSIPRNISEESKKSLNQLVSQFMTKSVVDQFQLTKRASSPSADGEINRFTEGEYKFFVSSSSGWSQVVMKGAKAVFGMAKDVVNRYNPLTKSWDGSPLEAKNNDQIPSPLLTVAGNSQAQQTGGQKLQFHHQILNQGVGSQANFQTSTFIDQTLYSLFVAYHDSHQQQKHPVAKMHSGSLLLYGGQPIGVLHVVNKAYVPRVSHSGILLKTYESYRDKQATQEGPVAVSDPTTGATDPVEDDNTGENIPEQPDHNDDDPRDEVTNAPLPVTEIQTPIPDTVTDTTVCQAGTPGCANDGTFCRTNSRKAGCPQQQRSDTTTDTTDTNNTRTPCDPATDENCADDGTVCDALRTKPGCRDQPDGEPEEEVTIISCTPGQTGCSSDGQLCGENPMAPGCQKLVSDDLCLAQFSGVAEGCPARLIPELERTIDPCTFQEDK
ncbi:MAG: hypothetical protein OXC40_00815 [Proteobacteria bacterium]|nr:hypothetical protein [Pseudomonadota bacterium]